MPAPNAAPLLRPNQYVEQYLVTTILDGTYPAGAALPAERALAIELGVTRQTLREALQRLATEGWLVIQHGKPTIVNDYWQTGGLRMLGTLAKYAAFLPDGFIPHLLQVRVELLPPVARLAATHHPKVVQRHLDQSKELPDEAAAYSRYDWGLQITMARHCRNPIYALILNDFKGVFQTVAPRYFSRSSARRASQRFYRKLASVVARKDNTVEMLVREAMEESVRIWQALNGPKPEHRPKGK